jgi:hypothetical protein
MEKRYVSMQVLFLLLALPSFLFAQTLRHGQKTATCLRFDCVPVEKLGLTEKQKEGIGNIEKFYNDQIVGLQNELMSRRFELRSLFRNPQAEEHQIRAKAQEIADIRHKCAAMMLDHQLEIRAVLTLEQLRIWCASTDSCPVKDMGKER